MNLPDHLATSRLLAAIALTVFAVAASAQAPTSSAPPTVTVTATATTTVANDRLEAWLRAEAEDVSPATAASQVNAAIAKALADAKSFAAVKVATAGYSTQQIAEKGKPTRWRVTQSISLASSEFTQAATLMSRLQDHRPDKRRRTDLSADARAGHGVARGSAGDARSGNDGSVGHGVGRGDPRATAAGEPVNVRRISPARSSSQGAPMRRNPSR